MTLAAGTRLGPYDVLSPLGAGGMGEVYRARDTRLGREVAVKALPAALSKDPDRLRRFEQEARAVSALNHPNILTIHDVGQTRRRALRRAPRGRDFARPPGRGCTVAEARARARPAELAQALASAGRETEARRILAELAEISKTRYVSPYFVATAHLALGERDHAFEHLERAFEGRSPGLTLVRLDPTVDAVRSDPRYADLVRRVGFPD